MKIYVLGDSISIQYGPYLETNLNGAMDYARKEGEEEALLNLDNPQGANGGDSSMVLSFLRSKATTGGIDADLLLVNCGLHDIKTVPDTDIKQVPIAQYKANLEAIVKTVSAMRPKLIWLHTTPCDEKIHNHEHSNFHRFAADCEAYNQIADQVMRASGIPIIDLYTFTCNLGNAHSWCDLYCDHVHFHDHIREKQADYIAGWLAAFTVQSSDSQ